MAISVPGESTTSAQYSYLMQQAQARGWSTLQAPALRTMRAPESVTKDLQTGDGWDREKKGQGRSPFYSCGKSEVFLSHCGVNTTELLVPSWLRVCTIYEKMWIRRLLIGGVDLTADWAVYRCKDGVGKVLLSRVGYL